MEQEELIDLLRASTLLSGLIRSSADRGGDHFTRTQENIFTILDLKGELSMKTIAGFLATSQEQATRTVAPLADAGYVERRTDPANRTRVYIRLTDEGRRVLARRRGELLGRLSKKLDGSLGEEDTARLCEAAARITALLGK